MRYSSTDLMAHNKTQNTLFSPTKVNLEATKVDLLYIIRSQYLRLDSTIKLQVPEDLISNKQKRTEGIYQKR